jgi:hypothetical protein
VTNGRVSRLRRQNASLLADVARLQADVDALWVNVFNVQAQIEKDKADEANKRSGYTSRGGRHW